MNMGVVNFVFCAFGKCLDILCFLLDLVIWIWSALVRFFIGLCSFLHGLPVLLSDSVLLEYWNLALLSMLTMTEMVTSTAHGALHTLGGWLQTLAGVFESFKMVGNLSSHMLWRTKELLHRGVLSGHALLRQTCEGCSIALSLVRYFVNTIVNMLLIGTQNCLAAMAGAWEAVSGPVHKALELALTLLTFLYSCLVGTSVLLWTPCQLALEFLGSLSHIFVTVFLFNLYGLLLTLAIVAAATLYLNPGLPRRGAHSSLRLVVGTVPGMRRLQRALQRLYLLALERAQSFLDNGPRQQATWPGSGVGRQGRERGPLQSTGDGDGGRSPSPEETEHTPTSDHHSPAPPEQTGRGPGEAAASPARRQHASAGPSDAARSLSDLALLHAGAARVSAQHLSSAEEGGRAPSLLSLLKEHEERKKCVICQDQAKTVLLLPCRHLCLCRHCSGILLCQPDLQPGCPLCRQPIAQSMDVYL